jgi:hypothetical protein
MGILFSFTTFSCLVRPWLDSSTAIRFLQCHRSLNNIIPPPEMACIAETAWVKKVSMMCPHFAANLT